jgi:hypothetical protein
LFVLAAALGAGACAGGEAMSNRDGGQGDGGPGAAPDAATDSSTDSSSDGASAVDAAPDADDGGSIDEAGAAPEDDARATSSPDASDGAVSAPVYEAESGSLFGQAKVVACASCSGGKAVSYAPDSGFSLSNVDAPRTGTNALVIDYVNSDTKSRSIYLGINGSFSQMLMAVFPPTGGDVQTLSVPLGGFKAGLDNMLTFFIDTELMAPLIDRVSIERTSITSTTGDACDRHSWKASASVSSGSGSPGAAIDGDLGSAWSTNHPQNGTDWFVIDFGALVKLPRITLDDSQAAPDDYPGGYAVSSSVDGVKFEATPFVTGAGSHSKTVMDFSQRTVRAVKIRQTGTARAPHWWQIGEVQVICYQ